MPVLMSLPFGCGEWLMAGLIVDPVFAVFVDPWRCELCQNFLCFDFLISQGENKVELSAYQIKYV